MIDFVIKDGDIELGYDRGIKLTDKTIDSIIRRAATTPLGYSKVIREGTTQRIINGNYGTDLAIYLSTAITGITLVNEIQKAFAADGRATLYNIDYKSGYNTIDISLQYSEPSSQELQTFNVSI